MLRYICILAVILEVRSASAPFINPCKPSDSSCLLSSAQAAVPFLANGIQELGVPTLDPMMLRVVKADQAGLLLTLKDTAVTGMKGCTVEGVKLDVVKGKLGVVIRCSVTLKGLYKLGGTLLVLAISGEGPYTIKIRDIVIQANADLITEKGADSEDHWRIGKWHHSFQVKTSARFDFDNLFNGNKQIADPVLTFVNSNWQEIIKEIAPPIVRAIVACVVEAVGAFFAAIPSTQLYLA